MSGLKETELYAPVKTFLEGQGYEVKGEIGACDMVGLRGEDDPVIVELKAAFSLALFHQGVARQTVSDDVYVAVPRGAGKRFLASLKANKTLCRRLGLGLITVRLQDGLVEVHLDPAPYRPKVNAARRGRLLREFARRVGDPSTGGTARGAGLVTAYRQDALRCATYLASEGPSKGAAVAKATGVAGATRLMAADHYGWFERVETGIYQLTPRGQAGLAEYGAVSPITPAPEAQ